MPGLLRNWKFGGSSYWVGGANRKPRSYTIYTSSAARGVAGSFKRYQLVKYIYINQKKHVPIETVCVTCSNTSHFAQPFF